MKPVWYSIRVWITSISGGSIILWILHRFIDNPYDSESTLMFKNILIAISIFSLLSLFVFVLLSNWILKLNKKTNYKKFLLLITGAVLIFGLGFFVGFDKFTLFLVPYWIFQVIGIAIYKI